MDSLHPCRNCNMPLTGQYCATCGQAAHEGHAPTLAHFFHDLVHELVHVDGKIFRSLHALFLRPGLLTAEYWAGHIVSWVRPIRLFLIAAALHLLLVQTSVGPINFRLSITRDQAGNQHVAIGQDLTNSLKPGYAPLPVAEQTAYFEAFRKAYTPIRYFSVVGFAIFGWLLYSRRQPYLVNHLIHGLHQYSFWYVLSIVGSQHPGLSKAAIPVSFAYLVLSLRRLYAQPWHWTLLRGFAFFLLLIGMELLLGFGAAKIVEFGWVKLAHG